MPWFYRGTPVYVPPTADIPPEYRLGTHYKSGELVQQVLNQTPPWEKGEDPIETIDLKYGVVAIVVPTFGAPVMWAKHAGHHAQEVGLSPFIKAERSYTRQFTVELAGVPSRPMVVRAYPGDYMPPLPWMRTAPRADGGREACLAYWRTHAYVLTSTVTVPDSESVMPPDWFDVAA